MARASKKAKSPVIQHSNPGGGMGGGMERFNTELEKLLQSREFATVDDVNAFLQEKLASGELNRRLDEPQVPDNPIALAQELCWQAFDSPTAARAKKLYEKALTIDPDCTDALIIKAQTTNNLRSAISMLERAVLTAAGRLGGRQFFQENEGRFWGMMETRPYMRAKAALAEAYAQAGRQLDAIAEYEHMLELCPNDNQGIRYLLLGLYLRSGELHRTKQLFESYPETSAVFLYGKMILAVLEQDLAGAKRLLRLAIRANPHVYEAMTGLRSKPLPAPADYYSPGEESEAVMALECLEEALLGNSAVAVWFFEQAVARGGRPNSPQLEIPLQ